MKRFFVDALSSALSLGIASPDDLLRHVTTEVLSHHLPRPLWARLLTASLGAGRVDASTVVDTVGIPNLCEHMPSDLMWICLADIGSRALGRGAVAPMDHVPVRRSASSAAIAMSAAAASNASVAIPGMTAGEAAAPDDLGNFAASLSDALGDALDLPEEGGKAVVERPAAARPVVRAGISSRAGASSRKPQTVAPMTVRVPPTTPRRGETQMEVPSDYASDVEAKADLDDSAVSIDDEQLVDWQPS